MRTRGCQSEKPRDCLERSDSTLAGAVPCQKHRRGMMNIPRHVANSFAFEGESLPEGWVEEQKRFVARQLEDDDSLELKLLASPLDIAGRSK